MAKRITLNDWVYIENTAPIVKSCEYALEKSSDGSYYYLICNVKWLTFIVMFIPVCVINFFLCCWNGGLIEYELPYRFITRNTVYPNTAEWERAKEIWEKK